MWTCGVFESGLGLYRKYHIGDKREAPYYFEGIFIIICTG